MRVSPRSSLEETQLTLGLHSQIRVRSLASRQEYFKGNFRAGRDRFPEHGKSDNIHNFSGLVIECNGYHYRRQRSFVPIVKSSDDCNASFSLHQGNGRHFQLPILGDAEFIRGYAQLVVLHSGGIDVYGHAKRRVAFNLQLAKDRQGLGVGDRFAAAVKEFGMHAGAKHFKSPAIHQLANQNQL